MESLVKPVSGFKRQNVQWIWPSRLPRGKLCILEGNPGEGKSTIAFDIAARLSTGTPLPLTKRKGRPTKVMLLSAEDSPHDTIRPRLEAVGANLDNILIFEGVKDEEGVVRLPEIPADVDAMRDVIRQEKLKLVVIDPLMAYLRGVDAYRDQAVRSVLHRLSKTAERTGCSFLIIRHLVKARGQSALYRGSGSIGIIGAARISLLVGPNPHEGGHVLAVNKSNLAPIPLSIGYQMVSDKKAKAAKIEWGKESAIEAETIFEASKGVSAVDEAKAFLEDLLMNGAMTAKEIQSIADDEGIPTMTLRRAKRDLKIRTRKEGTGWVWTL